MVPKPAKTRRPGAGTAERQGSELRGSGASPAAAQQQGDVAAWRAEAERVKDQLVISAPTEPGGNGEWRPQLERALASLGSLQAAVSPAQAEAEASGRQLAATAEALAAGSQAASAALSGLRAEHAAAVAGVAALQAEQAARRKYAASLQQELVLLNRELEERQRDMEQQGSSMSDRRPVARLSQACAALRAELQGMDVRTGVLQAILLRQAAAAAASGG